MDFEVDIDKMFSNFAPKKLIKVKNEIFSYWYDVAKAKSGQELRELKMLQMVLKIRIKFIKYLTSNMAWKKS